MIEEENSLTCMSIIKGTIFRLALRTEEQAQNSRLSSRIQAPDHVAHMLSEFADGLHLVLLFLRNVSKISIYEWRNGLDEPTKLNEAAISNVNSDVINKRTLKHTSMNDTNSAHGSFLSKGMFDLVAGSLLLQTRDLLNVLHRD